VILGPDTEAVVISALATGAAISSLIWLFIRPRVERMIEHATARIETRLLDPSELTRIRRFFLGNGSSELHALNEHIHTIQITHHQVMQRLEVYEADGRLVREQLTALAEKIARLTAEVARMGTDTQENLGSLIRAIRERERK
jgi:hypothetical protein